MTDAQSEIYEQQALVAKRTTPVKMPFTIAIDNQERRGGYRFTDIQGTAKTYLSRKLHVPTEIKHLKTGDYSIVGMEHLITVERKTLSDFYGTLGGGRERFRREHERMLLLPYAYVVIEASLYAIRYKPPEPSKMNPAAVYQTMMTWPQRYKVPWIPAGSRRDAEEWTFWTLEKFWRNNHELERM